ncbi:hypothetical protein [Liquorilactobacillus vini]|uniref:hypothetical protein n=1 Tax=Liquorilactobacillus vini TaxID=238015 RepID=UPI0002E09F5C|nr:hypothetical protein [Liquorilactobacillus vini]
MQFDDLGTWLQKNQLLAATANLRWQILLQRQLEKQPLQSTEDLGEFLAQAKGENLQPVEKIDGEFYSRHRDGFQKEVFCSA